MSIEIPVYKTVSLPVETQVANLGNSNLSQSSVANFNNLMSMPSAIERSSFDQRLDQNFTQNNNSMLNQILHSISTLDLSLKTSSTNLRQSFSKNNHLNERVSEVAKDTVNSSKQGDSNSNSSISSMTTEMNNNLEKVKNLYKLQHKFSKSMTLVTLFSSLLTAFKGTMDKFLKM